MFSSPSLILSLVVATLYAAAFHLLGGRSGRQLLITWLAALVGFGSGQALATLLSWHDPLIGELHLVTASAISWLFMFLAKSLRL
jgi:hypothetical protein